VTAEGDDDRVDSEALRSRRYRLHKAGNHSLCRRCDAVANRGGAVSVVAEMRPAETDGADPMARLAELLMAAYEANPSDALLARELRMTLQALAPVERVDGELAELLDVLRDA
jgi:hypothetical protein